MDQTNNETLKQEKEENRKKKVKDTEIKKETNWQDLQKEITEEEIALTKEALTAYKISRQKRVIACLTHLGMLDLISKK